MNRSQEKRRRYREWIVRWRWPLTLLLSFNLCVSTAEMAQKRSQWSELHHFHALTRLGDPSSIEMSILEAFIWTFALIQTWVSVSAHRRNQARVEQEIRHREAASQEAVSWFAHVPNKPSS